MWQNPQAHAVVHYYWGEAKKRFIRESDAYGHWAMLAPEQGTFQYELEGRRGEVGSGQLLLCPPGVPLYRKVSSSALSFHFVEFNPDSLPEIVRQSPLPTGDISIENEERLLSDYAYLRKNSTHKDALLHYLVDLLLLCHETMRANEQVAKPIDALILRIANHLDEHCAEPLKMEDVAREFGLSPSQLSRRFHAAYRKGPLQYLNSVRIHNIKEMLIHTDYTIDTIAQLNGFQNGFYMCKVFTQLTNMNPSVFRRTNRV